MGGTSKRRKPPVLDVLKRLAILADELDRTHGLALIAVGTAGPGRQEFQAWHLGSDTVDRDDGATSNRLHSDTPGEALRDLAADLDRRTALRGWVLK